MADLKISELGSIPAVASADVLAIVDTSLAETNKVSVEDLLRGAPSGTAAAPSIAFVDDPDTGIFKSGTNELAISTGGTQRVVIDSSGNVGIGTTSPASLGSGFQEVMVSGGTEGAGLQLQDTDGNVKAGLFTSDISGAAFVRTITNHPLAFRTNNTERMRIDSSGKLLIGTSSALLVGSSDASLQIEGSTPDRAGLSIRRIANSVGSPYFSLGKARGTTGTPAIVNDGDTVGTIQFAAYDGTDFNSRAAVISAEVDGTPGTNDMPGRLVFSTTADGASSPNERMRIDSSGNVGIGTMTPGRTLDVAGTIRSTTGVAELDNATQYKLLSFHHSGTRTGIVSYDNTNNWIFINAEAASSQFLIGTAGTERARIDSSGTFRVKGAGTAGVTDAVQLNGSAPANSLLLDASGRVLVGTSTSAAGGSRLQVEGTDFYSSSASFRRNSNDASGPALRLNKSRGTSTGSYTAVQSGDSLGIVIFSGSDGTDDESGAEIRCKVDGTPGANDMPGRLMFSTTADGASSPTERMRIKQTGSISCYQTGADALVLRSSQAAGTTNKLITAIYSGTGVDSGGTTSFIVYTNGNVVNTNNSYGAISDIKLKENIVDASSQWDDLKALQVRNYNFKEGQTHTQIGLIAQEVELVSPGLVSEAPDRDADGNDLGTVTKSVNYSVLYMKAVKALQEAMERIEVLEQRLTDAGIA